MIPERNYYVLYNVKYEQFKNKSIVIDDHIV